MRVMKFRAKILLLVLPLAVIGCTKKAAEAEKSRQDVEAKARADAAKKEMATLPKVFSTPDYLKKNEPAKTTPPRSAPNEPPKK